MAKHSHVAHKESHQTFRNVTAKDLRLINNMVLCKRVSHNLDDGVSGLAYPKEMHENQFLYQNADRVYEVVAVPDEFKEARWDTEIKVQPGDKVWVNVIDSLNSPEIEDVDGEYRLLKYQSLIVAKRGKKVIPLNGNVLLSNVFTELKFFNEKLEIIKEPAIIYALACVEYVGKPNKKYIGSSDSDKIGRLKKGSVVILHLPNKNSASIDRNYLEDELFAQFDDNPDRKKKKRYFYEQRRSILGVLENEDAVK